MNLIPLDIFGESVYSNPSAKVLNDTLFGQIGCTTHRTQVMSNSGSECKCSETNWSALEVFLNVRFGKPQHLANNSSIGD